MGYASGCKKLWEIIDDIAAFLMADAEGYWTDGDTKWDTKDRTGNNARRSLHYVNGSDEFYIALEQINEKNEIKSNPYLYGKGLRMVFSKTWDATGHKYPTSGDSIFIPLERAVSVSADVDMATLTVTYSLWYNASGFTLIGYPEPHADENQQCFIAVIERNPDKTYSDGHTTIFNHSESRYK